VLLPVVSALGIAAKRPNPNAERAGGGTVVLHQARLRGAHCKVEPEAPDFGDEPPLAPDGASGGDLIGRRRLSLHWFTGTILTGLCGAALMGGAVFASVDGETTFASAPERVESVVRSAIAGLGARLSGVRKTDRLIAAGEQSVTRQVLHIPITRRVHDRELVRTRSFARVFGNLSLTLSELAANIPPFNPQKLLADGNASGDDAPAAEPEAEVSFTTCDFVASSAKSTVTPAVCELNSLLPKVRPSTLLPLDQILARVREAGGRASANSPLGASEAGSADSLKLSYAAEGDTDPYVGFAPRVVPENITLLPKTNSSNEANEHTVIARKGETVGSILRELGARPEEIKSILAVLSTRSADGVLKEGEQVRVLTTPAGLGHVLPLRVVVADSSIEAAVALSDRGTYVPADIRNINTDVVGTQEQVPSEDGGDDDGSGVRLYQSIYETALRNNVPRAVIDEFIRVYAYDVDFQRKVEPGDSFDLLYTDDEGEGRNELRYVALTVGGETRKYYRYQTADDGVFDYYDETGKSAKKFLVRKPVPIGIMRSGFGLRSHPLLHYMKMHTGVDWAAPFGTPIFAAGNGVIDEIGFKGGYGKYVRIRHANGYQTAYGHMTAFARGLEVGSHVRQGQAIGFVGSSGLSTGAHVHFEILINDHFVNPMTVKLPRGRVLDGAALALFQKNREQLDTMLAHAPARAVAQAR
jgi:murein DD-endopeptidase MepM/ murein hydrolase activator NlpD